MAGQVFICSLMGGFTFISRLSAFFHPSVPTFLEIPPRNFILFYPAFPFPQFRRMSVPPSVLHSKVREGCAEATAVCPIPLHAGASTGVETTRYFVLWASCRIVALAHTAFCPYLSIPGRQHHGQTETHSACALRRASGMSQAERVPFLFARQTVVSLPVRAVISSL